MTVVEYRAPIPEGIEEVIREKLSYDPDSGMLSWRTPSRGRQNKDNYAGTVNNHGYRMICINLRYYPAHRVAWLLHTGNWPSYQIDHINGAKSDNRIANLRDVSPTENQRNKKRSKANKTGVVGVRWMPRTSNWSANIKIAYKQILLGSYCDFDDAVRARKEAEVKFGFHPNHGRAA